MRKLEFRAIWNKTGELMGDQAYNGQCFAWLAEGQDITIEQFTGLLDKNGVKIFEGDLIRNQSGRICAVTWHADTASFDCEPVKPVTGDSKNSGNELWPIFMEVIGNTHEVN